MKRDFINALRILIVRKMGYQVMLKYVDEVAQVPMHFQWGTYLDHSIDNAGKVLPGNSRAELSVTFNYSPIFKTLLGNEGINELYGRTAYSTIEKLERAVASLGTDRGEDHWKPTSGNVGFALDIFLIYYCSGQEYIQMLHGKYYNKQLIISFPLMCYFEWALPLKTVFSKTFRSKFHPI